MTSGPGSVIMRYFDPRHLPAPLQRVAQRFADLAGSVNASLPNGPEKSVALRKLLEAKDAAVRAALDLPDDSTPPTSSYDENF